MARNWKELGFVPDSDEDDEDSDNLNPSTTYTKFDDNNDDTQKERKDSESMESSQLSRLSSVDLIQSQTLFAGAVGNAEPCTPPRIFGVEPSLDDVSKSWVRATSPTSSVLSSPPASLLGSPSVSHNTEQLAPALRRNFRERKPDQIRPFLFDQMRYEKRMLDSGTRPVRIMQSQEMTNKRTRTVQDQTQDTDFEDEEEEQDITEESQPMDLVGSSPPRQIPVEDMGRNNASDSDGDLPDPLDLIRETILSKSKRQNLKRVYTSKNRPSIAPPTRVGMQQQENLAKTKEADIFDFPGLSPTNSPPIRSIKKRKPGPRMTFPSSSDSTLPWLDQSMPSSQATPQTPPTSAKAPAKSPSTSMVYVEDESVPKPITISSSSSSSDQSSDESIRSLKRKIQHVLPASHLRLNQSSTSREQKTRPKDIFHPIDIRAGVARPLVRASNTVSLKTQSKDRLTFLESDDSDEDKEANHVGYRRDKDDHAQTSAMFPDSNIGYAEEEDRVDQMLPSNGRKRRAKGPSHRPNVKRLMPSVSSRAPRLHQPKITTTLASISNAGHSQKVSTTRKRRTKKPTPPKLSILDVTDDYDHCNAEMPLFLKVAARAARSRKSLGRQSPTRKFVRLATREDTADAQSVLADWTGSKIVPRDLNYRPSVRGVHRFPFESTSGNRQTTLAQPVSKSNPRAPEFQPEKAPNFRKKIRVARIGQQSLIGYVSVKDRTLDSVTPIVTSASSTNHRYSDGRAVRYEFPNPRAAQLEVVETEYSRRFPSDTFKSTKRVIDTLYRRGHRSQLVQNNLQMSRFLADDNIVGPSNETDVALGDFVAENADDMTRFPNRRRSKKRPPRRIDAGAAIYRQPTELLSLDSRTTSHEQDPTDEGKLIGLAKFGTRYAQHFDVFHLQPGIYFHNSTFIGSGRLAHAITDSAFANTDGCSTITFGICEEQFIWGPWNEKVSEQMGVCVDWLLDQLSILSPSANMIETATHLVDYIQHTVTFASTSVKDKFIYRMSEILQDFSNQFHGSREAIPDLNKQYSIQILNRLSVIAFQLVQISKADRHPARANLEVVLQKLAASCIGLLNAESLDRLSQFYDDLQRLYHRERGIRNDHYVVESWVIIFHVLSAAEIPRASFWDTANSILGKGLDTLADASVMEHIWRSLFTLLPLLEFDVYGVVAMAQEVLTDNWALASKLIKRVFTLYNANTRQSASFNEYCRAMVSRCYYLMLEWGWWRCNVIVGTLFDFFASQKLAHLRNEEVYKSPRFLEELNIEPSLSIEPEDRCFHIFLKILALGLKHMSGAGNDLKGIRNLVTRVLPNHDRQYPKEEGIHQRDLASLRNHHDLLCTLYWAAPYGHGPSIMLLQKLVSAENSHNEAFLINLRSWTNLARYVLSSSPATVPGNAYEPLLLWQNSFFDSLLQYYLQLEVIAPQCSRDLLNHHVQTTINANRGSAMRSIQAVARAMSEVTKYASSTNLKQAMNLDVIAKMFKNGSFKDTISQELISSAVEVFGCYLQHLHTLDPTVRPQPDPHHAQDGFDSQEYLSDPDFETLEFEQDYLRPIETRMVLSAFYDVLRRMLYDGGHSSASRSFVERVIRCWGSLASLWIRLELDPIDAFLVKGPKALFEQRESSNAALAAWPLFLSDIFERTGSLPHTTQFDLAFEWMVAISKPQQLLCWENHLTQMLFKYNHFLVSNTSIKDNTMNKFLGQPPNMTINQRLLKGAIIQIQKTYCDKALLPSTFGNIPETQLKQKFSQYLEITMDSMKQNLHSLRDEDHKAYVSFVQGVVSQIHSHCKDICRLPDFFFQHSDVYWPEENDPKLYLAGITRYTLELATNLESTRRGLFYYLFNGLRSALFGPDALATYIKRLTKAGRHTGFLEYLLSDIVPSALQVAFQDDNRASWLISDIFMIAASKSLIRLLSSGEPVGSSAYHMTRLLKHMLNGLNILFGRYGYSIEAIHPNHQGIITVMCRFWRACRPYLRNHSSVFEVDMDEILDAFDEFAEAAMICFSNNQDINIRFRHFDLGKIGSDMIIKEMAHEVQKWSINEVEGRETVGVKINHGDVMSHGGRDGPRNLKEVLEGALPRRNAEGRMPLPLL